MFRELGDEFNQAQVLINLGDAYAASVARRAAIDARRAALRIHSELGHPDAGQLRASLHTLGITGR